MNACVSHVVKHCNLPDSSCSPCHGWGVEGTEQRSDEEEQQAATKLATPRINTACSVVSQPVVT